MTAARQEVLAAPPASEIVTRIVPPAGLLSVNWRELWAYRELLYFFIWRDIKVRYKQTVIGAGWAVIQPLFTMLIFTLFFGRLAKIPSNGIPYPVFFYSALLPWIYFSNAFTNGASTLVENQRVITKVYFPRVLLPLAPVLAGLLDFAIAFAIFLGLMLYYGIVPTTAVFFLPLFLLLAVTTAMATSLWLGAMNAIYRDVRYVVPFLAQLWMFASPVAYPSTLVPEKWRALYGLNPMAGVIEGFRWALTGQGTPPGPMIAVSSAVVLLLLLGGLIYFRRMESTIADVV